MSKQKSILVVLISFTLVLFFTYCDKGKSPVKPDESSIVGTWKLTKLTIETATGATVLTEAL